MLPSDTDISQSSIRDIYPFDTKNILYHTSDMSLFGTSDILLYDNYFALCLNILKGTQSLLWKILKLSHI